MHMRLTLWFDLWFNEPQKRCPKFQPAPNFRLILIRFTKLINTDSKRKNIQNYKTLYPFKLVKRNVYK